MPRRRSTSLEASRALDPSQGRAVSYLGLAYARAGRYSRGVRAFLLAGQRDLATEIEVNLTGAEREQIHLQLAALAASSMLPDARDAGARARSGPGHAAEQCGDRDRLAAGLPPKHGADRTCDRPPSTTSIKPSDSRAVRAADRRAGRDDRRPDRDLARRRGRRRRRSATPAHKLAAGSTPPVPLSQLATDELVRPDDGEDLRGRDRTAR